MQVILEAKVIQKKMEHKNYLVLQPMYKYFKETGSNEHIAEWKSKELSDEVIKSSSRTYNSFSPALNYIGNKMRRVKFDGGCLKQDKIIYSWNNSKHIHCLCIKFKFY